MADPQETQQEKPEESAKTFSEWIQIAGNRIKRWPFIRRLRIGRQKVGERDVPIARQLKIEGWFEKNTGFFIQFLKKIEEFWDAEQKLMGHGGQKGYIHGNPDGIVALYTKLGVYSDIDRIKTEAKWFEHGTNFKVQDL